jgi:hypothetical protein
MAAKTKTKSCKGELIAKIRKPVAPPARVEKDERKYNRKREAERLRRLKENGKS